MKCLKCKYAITPKSIDVGLYFICANANTNKGLVKINFECDKGRK